MKIISDISELRKIQMDILSYVDKTCREHNIHYSMSGGTLIGAIRHRGFIPWDDDIDIMLTREDYNRLICSIQEKFNNGERRYKILTHDIDHDFKFPYAKVVDESTIVIEDVKGCKNFGVFIDIFPIDYIPSGKCSTLFIKQRVLYYLLNIKRLRWEKGRSFIKNILIIISQFALLPLSDDKIISLMDKVANNASKFPTKRRSCLVWGYGKKEIVPASIHDNHIDLPFEDRKYMAIKDYDIYLTSLFGDYMQLPPEEKQVTHHDFKAFWK